VTQARAQGRHAGLTREQVLRAALALVDREGAGALSMRRLARDLGVEAMTLYHHVRNKQALEDALVEQVLADALPGSRASGPWQDVLAQHARALHHGLAAHPGVVPLFASRPALTARNLDELEALLETLTGAGFAPGTALQLVHAVGSAVVWHHLAESGGAAAAVPEDVATPPLVAAALAARPASPDARLDLTVQALVAGFATLLDRDGPAPALEVS